MEQIEEIYRKYYEDVFRFLRGLSGNEFTAEELTQETFFRALEKIDSYRGDADIRVWLCSIAKNIYFTEYKKNKRVASEENIEEYQIEGNAFEEMIVDKEIAIQIHKILHNMKEPYKEIFSLRMFGELSFKEIGEIFGKSDHWACVMYHRAKGRIQKERKDRNEI